MAYWRFLYPKRISFSPADFDLPGLGGSESRLVVLTRALAKRGHRVEVYNATWAPGEYDGVQWIGAWGFDSSVPADVDVSVRFAASVQRTVAARHLFWMLDDRPNGAQRFAKTHSEGSIVVASKAMRSRLGEFSNVIEVPLPIETRDYQAAVAPSSSHLCLYSSMPNRGLRALIEMWPAIRAAVPTAELAITSGWELWGFTPEEAADRWVQLMGTAELPSGVRRLGVLSREDLVAEQIATRVGLFPSTFPEMFCLAAAELAAAGKPLVATDLDALSERVAPNRTGFLVAGDPYDSSVQEQFVNRVVRCLVDDELADRMGAAAREASAIHDVESVVDQWEVAAAAGRPEPC